MVCMLVREGGVYAVVPLTCRDGATYSWLVSYSFSDIDGSINWQLRQIGNDGCIVLVRAVVVWGPCFCGVIVQHSIFCR